MTGNHDNLDLNFDQIEPLKSDLYKTIIQYRHIDHLDTNSKQKSNDKAL